MKGERNPPDAQSQAFARMEMDKAQLARALQILKDTEQIMQEYHRMMARRRKIKFDAYIGAGFTIDQAMQFCTMPGELT